MILLDNEVIELIKKPKNTNKIAEGLKLNTSSQLHFNGEGWEKLIVQLVGRETALEYSERRGLGGPVTMKQTEFYFRELTRWQNNPEIKQHYDFGKDTLSQKQFEKTIATVYNMDTISHFRNNELSQSIFTNMNDYIILEKPAKIIDNPDYVIVNDIKVLASTSPKFYARFIECDDVKDVRKTGNIVEYIIFEHSKKEINGTKYNRFRCIDSTTDRIFIEKSGEYYLDESEKVFTHSDIPVKQVGIRHLEIDDCEVCISPVHHVIPLQDRYLKFDSINLKSEVTNAYPKWWAFGVECPKCNGSKTVPSGVEGQGEIVCDNCKGLGKIPPVGNGEPMLIPATFPEGNSAFNSQPAGIIQTDTGVLEYQAKRLTDRDTEIIRAALGSYMDVEQGIKTATESIINIKPLEDRNRTVAEAVEYLENWICNYIGKQLSQDFKGYSVNIPKKLNILDENSLIKQIEDAKKSGATGLVKELVKALCYSIYRNDVQMLERQLVLIELDPMPGYSITDIASLLFVNDVDKVIKQYFDLIVSEVEKGNSIVKIYNNGLGKEKILSDMQIIASKKLPAKIPENTV